MTATLELKNAIEKSGIKYGAIAEKMGLSGYGLRRKITNVTEFKASEIVKLSSILELSEAERNKIFFAKEVI